MAIFDKLKGYGVVKLYDFFFKSSIAYRINISMEKALDEVMDDM